MEFIDNDEDHVPRQKDQSIVMKWLNQARDNNPLYGFVISSFSSDYNHCLCGHQIQYNFVAYCPQTNKAVRLGSDCIERARNLAINIVPTCAQCKEELFLKNPYTTILQNNGICTICKKQNAKDYKIISFGKHKGYTYKHVYDAEKKYIDWIVSIGDTIHCKKLLDFYSYIVYKRKHNAV